LTQVQPGMGNMRLVRLRLVRLAHA